VIHADWQILMAKKPQMLELARKLGPEAFDDPSLLHPLFSRLPPLFPDTPDRGTSSNDTASAAQRSGDDPNPYDPIALSGLFQLADQLMAEHPWDGPDIRGADIMGEGSVVASYSLEMAARAPGDETSSAGWTIDDALELVDKGVVRPGVATMDDEEDQEDSLHSKRPVRQRRRWLLRLGQNKGGTALALGVVLIGIGMALFGLRAGGVQASWARWWALVLNRKLGRVAAANGGFDRGLDSISRYALDVGRYIVHGMGKIL
jgi:hypothetical protein